jgi:hypothetical protein
MGKPYFLILGAQRSGTYSLWSYLRVCPELTPAITKEELFVKYADGITKKYKSGNTILKETSFFGFLYNPANIKTYENFYENNKKGFEASPEYFHIKQCAYNIYENYKDLKFIILLRNPIDRAWSHYWHEVNRNKTEKLKFLKAIKRKLKTHEDKYWFSYLQTGHYAEHLKRWFSLYDRANFFILDSESFFSKPDYWFKEIQKFLNCNAVYGFTNYPNISLRTKYPKMPDDIKNRLSNYYKPHNKKLYKLLNKRIWKDDKKTGGESEN